MSSLTATFDECRKQPDGETLEQMRAHYFTDAIMNEKDCTSAGGLNIPQADAIEAITNRKKQKKYAKNITFALKLLNDRLAQIQAKLAQLEDELIRNHGEAFAAHLSIDHLDDETYNHIMVIQDTEERRHEFAKALNEGLENGTIDADAFDDKPEFKEWLDVRKEKELNITSQKVENSQSMSNDADLKDDFGSLFTIKQ